MRQFPAASSSGATSTENSRSRSSHASEAPGTKTLSNGIAKEPIVTRSKSRLRRGRRLSGRSPKKFTTALRKSTENEVAQKKKRDKSTGNAGSSSASTTTTISTPLTSPRTATSSSEYARHYKSYRRLNGLTSRRGESNNDDHSNSTVNKRSGENSSKDSKPGKLNNNNNNKTREPRRVLAGSPRRNRTVSTRNTTTNHIQQNGNATPVAKSRLRNPSSRIRQLVLNKRKRNGTRYAIRRPTSKSTDSSPNISPNGRDKNASGGGDADVGKDKMGKRRSALWVLNCEAEEFLFGETAADKHEVELPPLAPPPTKKRRCRVNELGHLLEKSPILESKLRKSTSSECDSDTQRDTSPPRKRLKPDAQQRTGSRVKNRKQKEKTPEMCSSIDSAQSCSNQSQPQSPTPELLSPIPFLCSPDSIDHEARTVQFQQMLNNVDWGYSFEEAPVNEPWYPALQRTDTSIIPYESFVNPLHEPVVLPYEMDKTARRSRSKPVRNSRKSPRCHASTIAILASERPVRSTRSSVTLDTSPSASVSNLPSESTLQTLLLPPPPPPVSSTSASTSVVTTAPIATRMLSPPKYVPSSSFRRRHPSSPRSSHHSSSNNNDSKNELGASQYLWDSMQFLSDPYVVSLLSGEDPAVATTNATTEQSNSLKCRGFVKNNRCTNNNYVNCPVKSLMKNFETSSPRKASLRSKEGSGKSNNASVNSNCIANSRLMSVPKSSLRNHSHGTNHISGNKLDSSLMPPPTKTVSESIRSMNGVRRFTSRSPPLSSPSRQTVCPSRLSPKNSKGTNTKQSKIIKGSGSEGDNGRIRHEKSKKAFAVMADLYAASTAKTKMKSWEEGTLFIGDGLPPLPSWPV